MKTVHSLVLLTLLAVPAFAVDGVVLINQSIALAGGVTPGDTPGFPVTISVPGSYRLSGNLVVPDANTTAILVAVSNVTIDLNGFSILGPTVCQAQTVVITSCSPTGVGSAIAVSNFQISNTTVTNGFVNGMGGEGVVLASGGMVDKVSVSNSGSHGILASFGSVVSNSRASSNLGDGFFVAGAITNSTASFNGGVGIVAFQAAITGNNAYQNGGNGILATCPSSIQGNTAAQNTGTNILTAGNGCAEINNAGQ